MAVGLRSAAGGTVSGIAESSVRALANLGHVLPSRLRHRVAAIADAVVALPAQGPTVAPGVLTAIAPATRDHQRLRFDYTTHEGVGARREVEPHRLSCTDRRWYLVAWDVERGDWRTFRVDRMTPRIPTGPRFAPRDPPGGDVGEYVTRGVNTAMWQYRARVRLHAPAAEIAARLGTAAGTVEPDGPDTCVLSTGADTLPVLASCLGFLDVDLDVLDPPELRDHLRALGGRYLRAAGAEA